MIVCVQAAVLDNLSPASFIDETLSKNTSFPLNERSDRFEELRLRVSNSEPLTNQSLSFTNSTHESTGWLFKDGNGLSSEDAESQGDATESNQSPGVNREGGVEEWATLIGLALMVFYLVFDGFTSSYQDRLFREYKGSTYLMMLYATGFGVLASAGALVSVWAYRAWISREPGCCGRGI